MKQDSVRKTDTSELGLGAGLMQVRERMNCWQDEAPHNSIILRLTAFAREAYQVLKREQQ